MPIPWYGAGMTLDLERLEALRVVAIDPWGHGLNDVAKAHTEIADALPELLAVARREAQRSMGPLTLRSAWDCRETPHELRWRTKMPDWAEKVMLDWADQLENEGGRADRIGVFLADEIRRRLDAARPSDRLPDGPCSGAELIAAERQRQIEAEGWTPEHDDEHTRVEMGRAASRYLGLAINQAGWMTGHYGRLGWPWHINGWKPSPDPVRNLVKAGALIAAEIDRLQRAAETEETA